MTKYQSRSTLSIDSECSGGEEYSETKVDKDDVNSPILFVFGKDINGKLIYVKLKIRNQQKQVVCVSFHYAKDKMEFPYA